jgi:hypothetical protein
LELGKLQYLVNHELKKAYCCTAKTLILKMTLTSKDEIKYLTACKSIENTVYPWDGIVVQFDYMVNGYLIISCHKV